MPQRSERICQYAKDGDASGPGTVILRKTGRSHMSRWERLAFAALAIPAILYAIAVLQTLPDHSTRWDFSHYYASALVLRDGGDPYKTDLQPIAARLGLKLQLDQINRGTYPPTFIWCFSPLTRLPLGTAFLVWQALSLASLAGGLVLIMLGTVSRRAAAWLTLGVVFFAPVQLHLALSQSQFVVFLMLVLVIRALEHGAEAEAGLIIALAGLLRAYPLAMAGYFVVRRRWRALGWMGGGLAVGAAITVAAIGLKTCLDFRYVPPMITSRYFLEQPGNIALGSFVSRMFWHLSDYGLIGPHESARAAVSFAVRVALVVATAALTWTHRSGEPDVDRRAYSLWIATMILISPTAWNHYLVLLLLPFIQVTSAAAAGRVRRPTIVMCIASYVLIQIGILAFAVSSVVNWHPSLSAELGFMSTAAAWVAIALFAGTSATVKEAVPGGLTAIASQSAAVA